MEKNVTLTTEEICNIILVLQDKAMNIKAYSKVNNETMSEQTKHRLDAIESLAKKMFSL